MFSSYQAVREDPKIDLDLDFLVMKDNFLKSGLSPRSPNILKGTSLYP